MRVKVVVEDRFRILATMDGQDCPTESLLEEDDPACQGLLTMLTTVAQLGLDEVPAKWLHEASKPDKVYEFIKGNRRLFFFKGAGRDIAVCVEGLRKKGQKADRAAVARAATARAKYFQAIANQSLEVLDDET